MTETTQAPGSQMAPAFSLRNGQAQLNLDILNHIAKHALCSFDELYTMFSPGQSRHDRGSFKSRLSHLVKSEQLVAQKTDPHNVSSWTFSIGWRAGKLGRQLPQTGRPAGYAGVIVPPRQPNVLKDPGYQPKPVQALRPGSDEFTRLPSLRQGQRLPFTCGYVAVAGSKS